MDWDWRTLLTAFSTVFVAELGDKTQLATLGLTADSRAKWMVFAGSALALVTTSALAVVAGSAIAKYVPPPLLKRLAGGLFIVLGAWSLWSAGKA